MTVANVYTLIPRTKMPFYVVADVVEKAGQRLYFNGKTILAAPHHPGAGWHRIGIMKRAAA